MHYYKRNIGDYAKKAGRLTMLQHGAYTLLLDACYDRERFPTLDDAIDWTWASSSAETEAVRFVLRKFFTLEGDLYVHKGVQAEIEDYKNKSALNTRIAMDREAKRRGNSTKRERTVHEPDQKEHEAPPNQEPLTKNQHKEKKEKGKKKESSGDGGQGAKVWGTPDRPEDVDEQTWADWLALRARKRAPVTETVLKRARKEAEAALMPLAEFLGVWCARGSQGLEAGWLSPAERRSGRAPPAESFRERDERAARERWAEMTGRNAARGEVIDMTTPELL